MYLKLLPAAIAIVLTGVAADSMAADAKAKSGHKFRGSVEAQYRTNTNIGVAPSSGSGFDYADLADFEDDEDESAETDDEEEDEDDGDGFDDVLDVDPDEDEVEEDDGVDEDGDGIDDLIDPNADNVVDKEDRYTAKIGLNHKYQFAGGGMSWSNGVKLANDRHADRSDLDKLNYAVTSGFEFAPKGSKHSFKPSLSYVTLQKDSNKFVSTFVVSLGYGFDVSKKLALGVTYNYQDKDVTSPDSPDARIDTLALTAEYKATKEDIIKIKYAPKVEDSTQTTRNSDAYGYEFTYTRKLPWDMTAGFGVKFDEVDNKNLTPRRIDDNWTYGFELDKTFNKSFSVGLGIESRDRTSNIPSKSASNESFYLQGTWKF